MESRHNVGNGPTLVVRGGGWTNLKVRKSLTSWASFWGVARIPPGWTNLKVAKSLISWTSFWGIAKTPLGWANGSRYGPTVVSEPDRQSRPVHTEVMWAQCLVDRGCALVSL
jgi:hypothetical protein